MMLYIRFIDVSRDNCLVSPLGGMQRQGLENYDGKRPKNGIIFGVGINICL